MAKQKRYSLEFQERAVRRMKLGDNENAGAKIGHMAPRERRHMAV